MGALVEYANKVALLELDKVAKDIEAEMKAVVGSHSRTGQALGAIHIEAPSEFVRVIGSRGSDEGTKHLYYLDQGNDGSGSIIRSTREFDRRGRRPGKLKLSDGSYRNQVHAYGGIGFLKDIASKYQ